MEKTQLGTEIDWALLMESIKGEHKFRIEKYKNKRMNYVDPISRSNVLQYYLDRSIHPDALVVKNLIQAGIDIHHRDVYGCDAILIAP